MAEYSSGIVDRFMAWADRLPGSVWLFYLAMLAILIVMINSVAWLDASAQFGTFDLYRTSVPVYAIGVLALMHHLNRLAVRSLAAFRPTLDVSEAEYARFEYELTTLPAHSTWISLGLSLLFTVTFAAFTPSLGDMFRRSPLAAAVDFVIYAIVFGLIAVFMYHTLRQLRMVSRIHASAKNVSLFQPAPLYAFSGLTAQTGMGILLLNAFSILTDPATFVNPALNALTIFTSLVAVACFVLPLKGMHDRIASEKKRLYTEANMRLGATIQEIYRRTDTQDLTGIDKVNQLMTGLITTRDIVAKIPTWPWETGTLTGFLSAFLLPVAIRLIGTLLTPFVT